MFRPKLAMPVLNGFNTTHRYTLAVGLTAAVSTPSLNFHTIRLTRSSGSGTDSGRTTVSPCVAAVAARVVEVDDGCAAQCAARQPATTVIIAKRFTRVRL